MDQGGEEQLGTGVEIYCCWKGIERSAKIPNHSPKAVPKTITILLRLFDSSLYTNLKKWLSGTQEVAMIKTKERGERHDLD